MRGRKKKKKGLPPPLDYLGRNGFYRMKPQRWRKRNLLGNLVRCNIKSFADFKPIYDNEGNTIPFEEIFTYNESAFKHVVTHDEREWARLCEGLTDKEKTVFMELRKGTSQKKIGQILALQYGHKRPVSQPTVSRIRAELIKKIRERHGKDYQHYQAV